MVSLIRVKQGYKWYKHFKDGCEDIENDKRSGCISILITDDFGISIGPCHDIFLNVLSTKHVGAKSVLPCVLSMLTVFFDLNGIVYHEVLPQRKTVNKEYYLQVQRRLHEVIQ
uniref:Uncharacterized protein n=1 Tax=Homalodisca liturata TaxID=320908 RepID=A0A1B6HZF0_9HEMI